jgi:glucosamine-6-phosphate deaminase
MKVILGAQTIELASAGMTCKIATMHPPTMDFPVTFIQEHDNPKETVTIYASRVGWGK